ncbi:MAG: tetratricopeptide repeat protein, partial [Bryobacteraceae bacterium]|nr:tetratricopeptide repeat protein [Bryobacteraceae bacterium]
LDSSVSLFAVLVAYHAAAPHEQLLRVADEELRRAVLDQIQARKPASLPALKAFFEQHRQRDPVEDLSQYISFALSVQGPPDFRYRFLLNQLPPDVFGLQGLEKLMARFARETRIEELWKQAQGRYEREIERYHAGIARAVLEANAYVRSPTSGVLGRRFQVYLELLAPANQVHVRNYANDYFLVVTPATEPQIAEIRHAYLHYLVDPIVLRHAEEVNQKKPLLDFALGAPLLPEAYKKDFPLLVSKCLVKAIESRMAPASRRQALVEQALREGYILAPYFAEALPAYERQEQALRFYFPEMIKGIDLRRETLRLDRVEFAQQAPPTQPRPAPAEPQPRLSGPAARLEEAEELYAKRELEKAREAYLEVLRQTDDKNLHARCYYGLARIAALEKNPELAEKLFERTLELGPDPQTRGWTHVYLARLAEAADEPERARAHYRAALAVEGATAAARAAAEKGLASLGRDRPRPAPD